jgi:hypothetical protein
MEEVNLTKKKVKTHFFLGRTFTELIKNKFFIKVSKKMAQLIKKRSREAAISQSDKILFFFS